MELETVKNVRARVEDLEGRSPAPLYTCDPQDPGRCDDGADQEIFSGQLSSVMGAGAGTGCVDSVRHTMAAHQRRNVSPIASRRRASSHWLQLSDGRDSEEVGWVD